MKRCAHGFDPESCGDCSEERKRAKELADRRADFAKAALQGLLANESIVRETAALAQNLGIEMVTAAASMSVSYADALIAQLDKRSGAPSTSVSSAWVLNQLAGHRFPEQGSAHEYMKRCLAAQGRTS